MLGSSTLATAIAAPSSTVPTHSSQTTGSERSTMPEISATRASQSIRSMPNRLASRGTCGDTAENVSSGSVPMNPASLAVRPMSRRIVSSSGPTDVNAARMLAAMSRKPTTSSTRRPS